MVLGLSFESWWLPTWSRSAILLRNPKIQHRVHKIPLVNPVVSQLNLLQPYAFFLQYLLYIYKLVIQRHCRYREYIGLNTSLSLSLCLYRPLNLGRFFSYLILYTVGWIPWMGDHPVSRHTEQTQNKRTQTFMPRVGFETRNPVFEWAKTAHALDRAATVWTRSEHPLYFNIVLIFTFRLPKWHIQLVISTKIMREMCPVHLVLQDTIWYIICYVMYVDDAETLFASYILIMKVETG
jgi:hypothetical protein